MPLALAMGMLSTAQDAIGNGGISSGCRNRKETQDKASERVVNAMRFVIQRVTEASCTVDGRVTGAISNGFMVLIGVSDEDTEETADQMVKKMVGLRIFQDEAGKTNLALKDVGGALLLISQFTLYADCRKGNRPSFVHAGKPEHAERLYEYIIRRCEEAMPDSEIGRGIFGADMKISLVNDGPFTVILDSEALARK